MGVRQNAAPLDFKTLSYIQCVINGVILHKTVTEICTSMQAGPVLRTYTLYSIAVCSRLEAASDVKSGKFVGLKVTDEHVSFVILS